MFATRVVSVRTDANEQNENFCSFDWKKIKNLSQSQSGKKSDFKSHQVKEIKVT